MKAVTFGLLGAVVVAGCSDNRPDALTWSGRWSERHDEVASLIARSDADVLSIRASACEEFVTVATSTGTDLVPAPTAELDKRVHEWLDLVGAAGAECMPSAVQSQVLGDIASLADDIDAVVASEIPTR
jgi:hypothetical protein